MGHSIGRWDGDTLVVDTTHVSTSTITNNGLDHSENVHWSSVLAQCGRQDVMARQEFEDADTIENRGARWWPGTVAVQRSHLSVECDPSFATNYPQRN